MADIIAISNTETSPVEPVDLNQAKDWLKIDWIDQDELVTALITQCRQAIEYFTSTSLVSKSVELEVKLYKGELFELPNGPVVDNFTIEDLKNNPVQAENYRTHGSEFKKISGLCGEYLFEYSVGYQVVPESLILALKNELAFRYTHQGDQIKGAASLCSSAIALAQPYKRMAWR